MTTIYGADNSPTIQSSSTGVVESNPNSSQSLTNEFITLMVAQIQNQDPLNPTDGTQYVSQLAQFSQVESTENLVALMHDQMVMLVNMQVLSTANLVGQEVSVRSDSFVADGKSMVSGSVELSASSNTVTLEITDDSGKVHKIPLGAQNAGKVDFEVDTAALGIKGPATIKVVLDEGQTYQPPISLSGKVAGVSISSTTGTAILNIPGIGEIPFYDITTFGQVS